MMPWLKPIFLLPALLCLLSSASAQKAKYTDLYKVFDVRIAGYFKNNIHAWSASTEQTRFQSRSTVLTLHLFSPEMDILKETEIALGKVRQWNIDFQYEDTCYYANINYFSESRKSLLLRIDQYGKATDVSGKIGVWKKTNNLEEKNRFYSVTRKDNTIFAAVTESAPAFDSLENGDFIHLPGEKIAETEILEKLIVRKINITTRDWILQVFSSATRKFYNPLVQVTGSTILVTAMAELQSASKKSSSYKGPLLFVARMDTSLSDSGTSFSLLKTAAGRKDETYSPFQLFHLQNKILLLSRGVYQRETVYFAPGGQNSTFMQAPRVIRNLVTNSLKITLIDEKNKLLKDTIIQKKYESMEWDNFFISTSGKTINFFCSRKYTANKNGITHISINADGEIQEEDMIVDVHYEYKISRAKQMAPGMLLVPFTRKGKTGLVKLEYSTTE